MSDLIERLRAKRIQNPLQHEYGQPVTIPEPICAEAAETILALRKEVEALAWLERHTQCELSHRHDFCEDDPQWEVHAVGGGRNDREWTLVGAGETIVEAINAARAALATEAE